MNLQELNSLLSKDISQSDMEQHDLDAKFLFDKFSSKFEKLGLATILISLCDDGDGLLSNIPAIFIAGAEAYRDFMIEKGIDVLKLEGRIE